MSEVGAILMVGCNIAFCTRTMPRAITFETSQGHLADAKALGAACHTGATIHAAFADAGAAINGSLTFAGLSLADAQTKLTMGAGNAGGRSCLYVR